MSAGAARAGRCSALVGVSAPPRCGHAEIRVPEAQTYSEWDVAAASNGAFSGNRTDSGRKCGRGGRSRRAQPEEAGPAAAAAGCGHRAAGKRRGCAYGRPPKRPCAVTYGGSGVNCGDPSRVRSYLSDPRDRGTHGAPPTGAVEAERAQLASVSEEAGRRQAVLAARTERAWRRLQAVQVKQVERHVGQQLRGLRGPAGWSCSRRCGGSAELGRLARSCSGVLRAAEGALDSDRTASSSGGSSDSEEEEGGRKGGVVAGKTAGRKWWWVEQRAWLGSRWVWLQAQVSELEYKIRALTELYTHLRQVKARLLPDTQHRASRPSPALPNPAFRSSSAGDALRMTRADDAQLLPSAARVCPLPRQRRHKLIRVEGSVALRSKPVALPCACEPPVVCVLCAGSSSRPPSEKEECTGLDLCVHPVLTPTPDFPLAVHCGLRLQVRRSQNALRGPGLSPAFPWFGGRGHVPLRAGRARRTPHLHSGGGASCRDYRAVVSPGVPTQPITELHPLSATPTQVLRASSPCQPLRRRRSESSFDIDNLVMPLGLSGLAVRVQRLQYKEIPTPSWRALDRRDAEDRTESSVEPGDPEDRDASHPEEVEDLSDGAFLSRHAVSEGRERGRWGSWAYRRRRGRPASCHGEGQWSSRLVDGDACSPSGRQDHCADGASSPTSPPGDRDAEEPNFAQSEEEQQVFSQQSVLPWERRSFPLEEADLLWLKEEEEEEPEDACGGSGRSQSTDSGISVDSLELSPRTPRPAGAVAMATLTTTQDVCLFTPSSPSTARAR
ncbi:KAT8 regulatory NSL complex subunit 1-like [Denticeps clupeoides]|uniref:KAT8 regulatory NSL complex subunit 1-like n=1 Tax=Denticeps clupeoides TaxID=299321 RepID=UPI0010A4C737|nr:KAT8 regulatory NSL complex subunit 1-like [Denticeps clupeoides]